MGVEVASALEGAGAMALATGEALTEGHLETEAWDLAEVGATAQVTGEGSVVAMARAEWALVVVVVMAPCLVGV